MAHLWQDPVEALDEDGTVDVLTRLWSGAIGLGPAAWPTRSRSFAGVSGAPLSPGRQEPS